MTSKVSNRSPSPSPPEDHDIEEIEDALAAIDAVPYALWPGEMKAEFAVLQVEAARMLLALYDLGLIRFTCTADGTITAEVLERVRH
jgi:hypothetical protein